MVRLRLTSRTIGQEINKCLHACIFLQGFLMWTPKGVALWAILVIAAFQVANKRGIPYRLESRTQASLVNHKHLSMKHGQQKRLKDLAISQVLQPPSPLSRDSEQVQDGSPSRKRNKRGLNSPRRQRPSCCSRSRQTNGQLANIRPRRCLRQHHLGWLHQGMY